jgi:sialate O-acetylesterase
MISPLTPAKLAGVIWYQGESNTGNPQQYKTLFPLLIEDWRSAFRNSRLPFYFVQIAPYGYTDGVQSQYLREAQLHALSVENTGMAVALDIGDSATIHPANKQEVGRRLARIALARDYGRPVPWSGPVLRTAQRRGAVMELTFDNAEGGLVLKEGRWGNEFRIAGDDRVFKSAQLRIRGATVFVSHPGITVPRSVRYAFRNSPEATLFNRAGLPASSFRTDEWEN